MPAIVSLVLITNRTSLYDLEVFCFEFLVLIRCPSYHLLDSDSRTSRAWYMSESSGLFLNKLVSSFSLKTVQIRSRSTTWVFAASLVNGSFSGTGTYWVGFVLSAQCQRIRCRPHQMLLCPEVAVTYYYDNQLFTMPYLLINWSKSCIANLPLSWHYDPHGWRVLRSLSGKSWANG